MEKPIHMRKREMKWDDSTADYISQKKSNPHVSGEKKTDAHYADHGKGNHYGEKSVGREEGRSGKGMTPSGGPRTDNDSVELSDKEFRRNWSDRVKGF